MRKTRKQKFLERKESTHKAQGNPIYSYVSQIDFGDMAYTAKPKQEYCRKWDYRNTVLWREQENSYRTLIVESWYPLDSILEKTE